MNKKLAFTLIELLVVIAVIGILSGLIVVSMSGVTNKATIARAQVFSNSLRNSLMSNLVFEWKLDENTGTVINDSWSNTTGTLSGGTWKTGTSCINGSCVYFNGTSDYINLGDTADPTEITVAAWIKIGDALPIDWGTVIAKGNQGSNNHFWLCYRTAGSFRLEYGNGTTRTSAAYSIIPTLNTWYYLVGTYVSGSGQVFLNGDRGAQQTALTGSLVTNDNNLTIGRASYTSSYYWTGTIDEVRLFDKAVPVSQIREMYFAGLNKLLINGSITKEEYLSRANDLAIK